MNQTYQRINAHTVEVTTFYTNTRNVQSCPQCGMYCTLTDTPTINHTMRAGETKCYGCQWANVSLSGRKYAGISFDKFCEMKRYIGQLQEVS